MNRKETCKLVSRYSRTDSQHTATTEFNYKEINKSTQDRGRKLIYCFYHIIDKKKKKKKKTGHQMAVIIEIFHFMSYDNALANARSVAECLEPVLLYSTKRSSECKKLFADSQ